MGKDSSEIRREIDATRARMGDTVEALGYKADVPSRVKDAVNDRVETVKGSINDAIGSVVGGVQNASQRVGEALNGAQHTVGDRLGDTADRLGNAAGSVTDRLPDPSGLRDAAQYRVGAIGSAARRGAGIAAENPLGLAIGAAAVGFLAGLLVPVTDIERSTVGPIRDDLMERAQNIGADAIQHGKAVLAETAQAAMSTAQDSAQRHVRQVADEASGTTAHDANSSQSSQSSGSGSAQTQYGVLQDELT